MTDNNTTITRQDNLSVFSLAPSLPFVLTFSDGNSKIGSLTMVGGQLRFEGNADASAKVFFDYLVKLWGDR